MIITVNRSYGDSSDRYNSDTENDMYLHPDDDNDGVDSRYDNDENVDPDNSADYAGLHSMRNGVDYAGAGLGNWFTNFFRAAVPVKSVAEQLRQATTPIGPAAGIWGASKNALLKKKQAKMVIPSRPFLRPTMTASRAPQSAATANILANKLALAGFSGFGALGANEDYCDKTYPRGISAQVDAWNTKCKKGGSITNPGAYAAPWTVVGKNARGLPDDSILGTALKKVSALVPGKTPTTGAKTGITGPGGPSIFSQITSSPYLLPVAVAAVAGVVLFKMKRK